MLSADQIEAIAGVFGEPLWYSLGGQQINVPCPYCPSRGRKVDTTGHLGINVVINKAHCVRCGWGHGNARKWLQEYRGLAIQIIEIGDIDVNFLQSVEANPPEFEHNTITLPPGCVPFHKGHLNTEFGQSLIDKNMRPGQMRDLYAAESGKYAGYVIFPFYEHGELVYWQGRAATPELLANKKLKKKNPDKVEAPLGKAHWLYGYDDAPKEGTAFLCEGTLDRKSLHAAVKFIDPSYYALGLQGTSMSFPSNDRHFFNSQFGKLWSLKPKRAYVVLDDDAWTPAKELAQIVDSMGIPCHPIRMVGGDPNEIAPAKLIEMVKLVVDDDSGIDRMILDIGDLKPR